MMLRLLLKLWKNSLFQRKERENNFSHKNYVCISWFNVLILSLNVVTTWCIVCIVCRLTRKHIHLRKFQILCWRVILSLMTLLELSTLKALISTWLEETKISLEIHHWCQGIGMVSWCYRRDKGAFESRSEWGELRDNVLRVCPRGHWLIWRTKIYRGKERWEKKTKNKK